MDHRLKCKNYYTYSRKLDKNLCNFNDFLSNTQKTKTE